LEKIELGCGVSKRDGFTGIDILDRDQEILWDLRNGIPIPDNSVNEIFSSHFVEHLEEKDIEFLIDEIVRVCKRGAEILIVCPHSDSQEAYFPQHLSLWNEKKVKGICQSTFNRKEIIGGYLEEIDVRREGIEIHIKLRLV